MKFGRQVDHTLSIVKLETVSAEWYRGPSYISHTCYKCVQQWCFYVHDRFVVTVVLAGTQ
uniref:Uncharacterized protein n=1 Tax=Meloidogyne enterolobii TaxID=390850 RepID=A0A6V7WYN1_MELEN|nr:unnamed protein product [Meloidogyne enterolobii]